jgi:hypothetical protein
MKVRMISNHRELMVGHVYDLAKVRAEALIEAGVALDVPKVERAVRKRGKEKAVRPPRKK